MNDAVIVSKLQCAGDLIQEVCRGLWRQGSSLQAIAQGTVGNIEHNQVVPGLFVPVVKCREYVVVVELIYRLGFAPEAFEVGCLAASQYLDGNILMCFSIVCKINLRHSTAPETSLDLIVVECCSLKSRHFFLQSLKPIKPSIFSACVS